VAAADPSQLQWERGLAMEDRWREWFEAKLGKPLERPPAGAFSAWDFRAPSGVTFEVKFDERAAETGNLCFELHGGERGATGLLASRAVWLVYLVPGPAGLTALYLKRMAVLLHWTKSLMARDGLGWYVQVDHRGSHDCPAFCWLVPITALQAAGLIAMTATMDGVRCEGR